MDKKQLEEFSKQLTDDQKAKIKQCKNLNDFMKVVGDEGIALPDELLEHVSGGDLIDMDKLGDAAEGIYQSVPAFTFFYDFLFGWMDLL